MVFQPESLSTHNRFLGTKIPHPSSTNFDEDFPSPPSKRIKNSQTSPNKTSSGHKTTLPQKARLRRSHEAEISDSEDEDGEDEEDGGVELPTAAKATQLES